MKRVAKDGFERIFTMSKMGKKNKDSKEAEAKKMKQQLEALKRKNVKKGK